MEYAELWIGDRAMVQWLCCTPFGGLNLNPNDVLTGKGAVAASAVVRLFRYGKNVGITA
jgi:hypothetical protein